MNTIFFVNEFMLLPDGTFMVKGTRIAGPSIEKGQTGRSADEGKHLAVEVVEKGVIDPNLDTTGRQGLLLKVTAGEAMDLRERTLVFT